jgi:hypothetical protein
MWPVAEMFQTRQTLDDHGPVTAQYPVRQGPRREIWGRVGVLWDDPILCGGGQ